MNAPIPDGRYDAFVVEARARDANIALTVAITTGKEKGAVVDLISNETLDEVTLIGLACTLVVESGAPHIIW